MGDKDGSKMSESAFLCALQQGEMAEPGPGGCSGGGEHGLDEFCRVSCRGCGGRICGRSDGTRMSRSNAHIVKDKLRGFCFVLFCFYISDQITELAITWYHGILRSWLQGTCFGYI